MSRKRGQQLSYALHVVLDVATTHRKFKLRDTDLDKYGVCKSSAYRILNDLCLQGVLSRNGKKYSLCFIMKEKLTRINKEAKEELLKQTLVIFNRTFNAPVHVFLEPHLRKELTQIFDIPKW